MSAASSKVTVEVPAFAKSFPKHPELDRIVTLFAQGNYARVRKDARVLLAKSEDADVRAALKDLLHRLEPDPLAIYLIIVTGVLLAILAGWYWMHPHEAHAPPKPPAPGP